MRGLAVVAFVAMIVAACASPSPSAPVSPSALPAHVPPSAPPVVLLPTTRVWLSDACIGVGLVDATLSGDPADSPIAWLDLEGGGRREIVFPPGYTVRFTPTLEVVDDGGQVVARAGDRIDGGCLTGSIDDPLLILSR